jgi:hypothetical protein
MALLETVVTDPAPEGAPVFGNLSQPLPGGMFRLEVTLPSDEDVETCALVWTKKDGPDNPFAGLTMEQALELSGTSVRHLSGGPDEMVVFHDEWSEGTEDGDVVAFACAASDDPNPEDE